MPAQDLIVNGTRHRVDAEPERPLLGVLREDLGLTGSRYGCGEGQCGACTVLIDGTPRRSCLTPMSAAAGRQITTIEGLERDGKLHPVQQAFLDAGAMQCAYCTSGMIMSGVALLQAKPHPTRDEILHALEGNLCRCGAYSRILAALERAAGAPKEGAGK